MLFDWANTIFEMLTRLKFWHNEKESTTGGQVAPSPQPVGNDSREQPAASSVTTFVTGINVVYEPKITNEATVDIVFSHGITGNREATWTAEGAMNPWPGQFLPKVLPKARILLFGYDARVVSVTEMVSQGTIKSHAKSLLNALANSRGEPYERTRPIIFVVHSMGGLVCEDALLLSNDRPEPHLRSILTCTKAIAFLGTPHAGARALAQWAAGLGSCINIVRTVNKQLLSILKTNSQVLARIQESFHTMVLARQRENLPEIQFTCFYEQIMLPVIGYVVDPQSAILPAYNSIPMNKTHITMTKFSVDEDPDYKSLLGELRRWYQELTPDTTAPIPLPRKRKPQNENEMLVLQHAQELQVSFDEIFDQFMIPMPFSLLPFDEDHHYRFKNPDPTPNSPVLSNWQRLLRLFNYGESSPATDHRLRLTPLALIPIRDRNLLALVRTSDVFRILASRVSRRQKGRSSVLVHNTQLSIVEPYQQIPVLRPTQVQDGHWVTSTDVPTRQWGDAFTGPGSLPPDVPYNINFVCSQPGYEAVQMPALLALREIPRNNNVLFAAHVMTCYALWQSFVTLLCETWDHDDTFECTDDEIPLKKYVDSYAEFAQNQRLNLMNDDIDKTRVVHNTESFALTAACVRYFADPARKDMSFENEDLVNCIGAVHAHRQAQFASGSDDASWEPPEAHVSNEAQLLEGWYARWGTERTRWLLIVLTTTLGRNACGVQALPESFDCLLKSPNCYVE